MQSDGNCHEETESPVPRDATAEDGETFREVMYGNTDSRKHPDAQKV